MSENKRDALTVTEARESIGGISVGFFYQLVNSGQLRTFKIGRRRLISRAAIHDFICDRENAAASDQGLRD